MTKLKLNIAEVSKAHGVRSAYQLSRESRLIYKQVRSYWNNSINSVSLEALSTIADTLGVSPVELIKEEEVPATV